MNLDPPVSISYPGTDLMGRPMARVRNTILGGFCQSRILELHGLRIDPQARILSTKI
jgi:hypothetical protein